MKKNKIKYILIMLVVLITMLPITGYASMPDEVTVKTPINTEKLDSAFGDLNNTVKYYVGIAVAITLVLSVIILYYQFLKLSMTKAHPIYRREAIKDILTVLLCIALLSGGGTVLYLIIQLAS